MPTPPAAPRRPPGGAACSAAWPGPGGEIRAFTGKSGENMGNRGETVGKPWGNLRENAGTWGFKWKSGTHIGFERWRWKVEEIQGEPC